MQTFMIKNNILLDQISELSNGQNIMSRFDFSKIILFYIS